MLHQIDSEAGGSDHHGGYGGGVFHLAVAVEVFEAMILKQPIGFVEVVHVHTHGLDTVHGQLIALGDIQIEAIFVLHADARDAQIADVLLDVAALKAQHFKQPNDGLGVLCDDLRVKARDHHGVSSLTIVVPDGMAQVDDEAGRGCRHRVFPRSILFLNCGQFLPRALLSSYLPLMARPIVPSAISAVT